MKKSPRINHRYYSDYVGSSLKANENVFSPFFIQEEVAWELKPESAWVFRWVPIFAKVVVCTFNGYL